MQKVSTLKTKNILFNKIDAFCEQQDMLNKKNTVILACSGGPDSVFLAYYLSYRAKIVGFSVILAYFDHEWRKESKDEIVFCRNLAMTLGFEFVTSSASILQEKIIYSGSKEEHARDLRYAFFYDTQQQKDAQYIVLAHHLDDQIETFFIRLLRGSSLSGICGMQVRNNQLLRPLLGISKQEIIDWLTENNISWCHDQTNDNTVFLRNNIRNAVIPALKSCDDRFVKNTEKLMRRLQSTNDYLELVAKKTYEQISFLEDNVLYLCISQLLNEEKEIQYRVLLRFLIQNKVRFNESESFFKEVLRFLNNKANTHQCAKGWQLVKISRFCPCCNDQLKILVVNFLV